jgi:hypothetical protein
MKSNASPGEDAVDEPWQVQRDAAVPYGTQSACAPQMSMRTRSTGFPGPGAGACKATQRQAQFLAVVTRAANHRRRLCSPDLAPPGSARPKP